MQANPEKIQELIEMQTDPEVKASLQREWNTFQKYYTLVGPSSKKEKDKRRTKAKAAKQARKQNRKK
jgi:hypothetical protein